MIIEGITFGFIYWLGSVISFWHLPKLVKNFLLKHFMLSEILYTIGTYLFISAISKSIIALIGAIFSGLLMNITMLFLKHFVFNKKL